LLMLRPAKAPSVVSSAPCVTSLTRRTCWLLACDLPLLDAETVRNLLHSAHADPQCAATVAQTDRVEPALVVWNRIFLDDVLALFDGGERAVYRVLDQIDTQIVHVRAQALTNVNRPLDVPSSGGVGQ